LKIGVVVVKRVALKLTIERHATPKTRQSADRA
jgi:hypothetical protein